MRWFNLLISMVVVLIGTFGTFGSSARLSNQQLQQQFNRDGYDQIEFFEYQGKRGVKATSSSVKLLSTGEYKSIFYVEGNWYQMGWLRGRMTCHESNQMLNTFIEYELAELVSEDFTLKHKDEEWFKIFIQTLTDMFERGAYKAFQKDDIPAMFNDQMDGFVEGCREVLAQELNYVTKDRLATLAYGMDFLVSKAYSGSLGLHLRTHYLPKYQSVLSKQDYLHLSNILLTRKDIFRPPVKCNSFSTRKTWNKDPSKVYFARDFQQPNGLILNSYTTMIIYNPDPSTQSIPHVSITAHGMIGSVTAINRYGVAMGVDVLRSGDVNPHKVGINSIMLVEYVVANANSTRAGIDLAANTHRGVSWFYPLSDGQGDLTILESFQTGQTPTDPLSLVPRALAKHLPTQDYLRQHNQFEWKGGMYIRNCSYTQPKDILSFNKGLFDYLKVPYPQKGWADNENLFSTYQEEDEALKKLGNDYFAPQRLHVDAIVVANHAIIPQARIAMMSRLASWLGEKTHATQYRYDELVRQLVAARGKVDIDVTQEIITFLSPDRTPGFWHQYLDPNDKMTASVEGSIVVAELTELVVRLKSGFWKDDWLQIHLGGYF